VVCKLGSVHYLSAMTATDANRFHRGADDCRELAAIAVRQADRELAEVSTKLAQAPEKIQAKTAGAGGYAMARETGWLIMSAFWLIVLIGAIALAFAR
jgi:hypothetical protein